jgi:hypothetical protein
MVRLIKMYEKLESFDKAPLFVVHNVQTAAITHLLTATSTQPEMRNKSIRRFRVCVDALEAMGSRWPRSKQAVAALRELASRWEVISALPMRCSAPLAFTGGLQFDGEEIQATANSGGKPTGNNFIGTSREVGEVSSWDFIDHTDLI